MATEIPQSALRTMTWPELWACEEDAVATGDERARRAACDEMRRRRQPQPAVGAGVRGEDRAARARMSTTSSSGTTVVSKTRW